MYLRQSELYMCKLIFAIGYRPMIEMTLPSSLDPTVAPPGAHVAQMFIQYTPYSLAGGKQWDEESKQKFANTGAG